MRPPAYRGLMPFAERYLRSMGLVAAEHRQVKRYHITLTDEAIDGEIAAAADAFLPKLLPTFDEPTPPAGFSVLHRGEDAVWLLVYSWVWDEVLHCRIASAAGPVARQGARNDDPTDFAELSDLLIGCVWELAVAVHERAAWVRHMLIPDHPDLDGYLADVVPDGPVGGP